mmetsp:Transcript_101571/g.310612  ORF Transcript_101571/g.310612 Transcript_101571/m.310612 type:complete len:397 (+) Transcript_101571:163-1353(+)
MGLEEDGVPVGAQGAFVVLDAQSCLGHGVTWAALADDDAAEHAQPFEQVLDLEVRARDVVAGPLQELIDLILALLKHLPAIRQLGREAVERRLHLRGLIRSLAGCLVQEVFDLLLHLVGELHGLFGCLLQGRFPLRFRCILVRLLFLFLVRRRLLLLIVAPDHVPHGRSLAVAAAGQGLRVGVGELRLRGDAKLVLLEAQRLVGFRADAKLTVVLDQILLLAILVADPHEGPERRGVAGGRHQPRDVLRRRVLPVPEQGDVELAAAGDQGPARGAVELEHRIDDLLAEAVVGGGAVGVGQQHRAWRPGDVEHLHAEPAGNASRNGGDGVLRRHDVWQVRVHDFNAIDLHRDLRHCTIRESRRVIRHNFLGDRIGERVGRIELPENAPVDQHLGRIL